MVLADEAILEIEQTAHQVRKDVLRMVNAATCGHPGGPLGMADFMSTLFLQHFNLTPKTLHKKDRDRLVLGNGHTCAGYYALLAAKGIIPQEELMTFRKFGSRLQGHPHRNADMGIDFSTGSLGNSLSVAVGIAMGAKLSGYENRIFSISSDGESQEGQIWEAAMSAAHYQLGNLTALVDFNNVQIDGHMRDVMNVRDLKAKYEAFGWVAMDVDGHDVLAVHDALEAADAVYDKPTAIICHTIIGKGVSFMEDQPGWHGVAPNDEQLALALAELGDGPV
jgi:transketolase